MSNKSSDVRLQENGWIRIISHFVEEKTLEEIEKEMFGDSYKSYDWGKKILIRKLHVKIQFLKPCTATTHKLDKLSFTPGEKSSPEDLALFEINLNQRAYESKKMSFKEFTEANERACSHHGIDYDKFLIDLTIPKFRCDYRIKVFSTFLNQEKVEIESEGIVPIALYTDSSLKVRKIEMLPGETTYVTFGIPDDAKSWKVWAPK